MLIKKGRCHCHQCRGSRWNKRTKKRYTKGTTVHKDMAHKQRVRQLRRAKLDKNGELMFNKTVGYTD